MSAVFEPRSAYSCAGNLAFADAARHAPYCRPGFWKVCAILDADLAKLLDTRNLHWVDAVVDDFGNLVRVPSPAPRRFAVTVRMPNGFVETYLRVGGDAVDHSYEALHLAGGEASITVHPVREGR